MKRCTSCGQILAQRITTCPACGSRQVAGMTAIDDYKIQAIIHEGRSSLVCRAIKEGHKDPVTIRLFTDQSGVDDAVATRLEKELKTLAKLPEELFVQHYAIRQSRTGHWYRVSEWVDADNWGSIFVSGILNDQRKITTLFYNIASALALLHAHDHFMPYLILDDILLPRDKTRNLAVKINYKLSRFLNARATHHGPMLKKLLQCHPDIVNQRAIDFRSGIWSLGKVFVELLTADHNLTEFSSRVDRIQGLDPSLAILIKVMLSDDPDLRPQSMARVARTLERLLETIPSVPVYPPQDIKTSGAGRETAWLKRVVVLLLIMIAGFAAGGMFFYLTRSPETKEENLAEFLESHTRSVGFLMVEYWLRHNDQVIYRNKVEGTAFLVDHQGYMLTNRHVACPWLEDATLFRIRERLKDKEIQFGHRMFLWFEGAKAFNRFQGVEQSADVADAYYLSAAFRSDGNGGLRVAGVPRGTRVPGKRIHMPFHNDFAVLKVNRLPEGIVPFPMETGQNPVDIKRLSPVIIMGFPLGSRTQDERINASITRGHVRRTSNELIQVDSSIYKGNSGGPAINARGRVIGIASGVITDQPLARLPLQTPLSDFGLVLPIAEPAQFVAHIKQGQPKWNGLLDFTAEKKLNQVIEMAADHDFKGAAGMARDLLAQSQDPAILFTAAMMDFCINDLDASRLLFTRLLSVEGENMASRLMLYIIDWLSDTDASQDLTRDLVHLDWDHSEEYMGYLARILQSEKTMDPGFIEYENRYEKGWRLFIHGLVQERQGQPGRAIKAFEEVILTAAANDHLYFMSFSRLNRLLDRKAGFATDKSDLERQAGAFRKKAAQTRKQAKADYNTAVELIRSLEQDQKTREDKTKAFESLLEMAPDNRTIMGRAAFFHAQASEWDQAVNFIDRYFKAPSRETALSLSLGLLKGQILKFSHSPKAAAEDLARFRDRIQNSWYGIIAAHLLAGPDPRELVKLAAQNPARLVVLHTALGLDSEAEGLKDKAARQYREALGTYLDSWNEYDLARARLAGLKETN